MEPQSRVRRGQLAPPPVVVVVVVHDTPSDRLHALLGGLAAQDYPNHRVLVVDAASRIDPTPLVHRVLPDARVLRLGEDGGFGASANQVLDVVDGAAYYLFCHDDAVPEPGAVSALVHVALSWQADIVGPKLVAWDDPSRLQQVGLAVDKVGATLPFVEPGEIDQAQHDGLRDVFTVPGAFTLVGAEMFEEIGGFDEAVSFLGDDLSLCWRARIAGARVLVTSSARVRHAQGMAERLDGRTRRRLSDRHRLRAMLMCTGGWRLAAAVPQALLVTLATALVALATGRFGAAGDAVGAWAWNLKPRRLWSLVVARRHVASFRQVPDRTVRQAQVRGLIGPRLRLRRLGGDTRRGDEAERTSPWSDVTALVWLALVGVLVFGSRHMITQSVPAVGEMVPFDAGPGSMLAEWASGWREVGLGTSAAAPSLLGALAAVGAVAGDHMGGVRTLLMLGLLPVGILGAHRLLRPTGSRWAQMAAALAYAALPVPYNALAGGRWSALAAYAGAPWMLGCLARASGWAPFGSDEAVAAGTGPAPGGPGPHGTPDRPPAAAARSAASRIVGRGASHAAGGHGRGAAGRGGHRGAAGWGGATRVPRPWRRHALAAGLLTGVVGLLVPTAPLLLAVAAGGLALGALLAGEGRGASRVLAAGLGGAGVAALLHLPVTLGVVRSTAAIGAWLGVERPAGELTAGDLVRFDTGPFGAAPLGFGLVVAALVPLLVGRRWRLGWAVRAWTVAVVFWGIVWVQQQGGLQVPLPHPDVLLAPAGAALALAVALGVAAAEADLREAGQRFGARRLAAGLGGVALVAAAVPVVGGSLDGWWKAPRGDFAGVLSPVVASTREAPSRVLWVGDPDVLPGGAGFAWRDGVSYATSLEGMRGVRDLWTGPETGATGRLGEALDLAVDRRTTRLGRLLAPMGVTHVVVPLRLAPSPFAAEERPVPPRVLRALGSQLDLVEMPADPAVVVYRNTAAVPARALVAGVDTARPTGVGAFGEVDLSGSLPVLPEHDGVGYRGSLPPGFTLVQASTASHRWRLEVDGEVLPRSRAWGWANAWPTAGGNATLTYEASPLYRLLLVVQVGLWLAALVAVLRARADGESPPRPRGLRAGGGVPDADDDTDATAAHRGGWRGGHPGPGPGPGRTRTPGAPDGPGVPVPAGPGAPGAPVPGVPGTPGAPPVPGWAGVPGVAGTSGRPPNGDPNGDPAERPREGGGHPPGRHERVPVFGHRRSEPPQHYLERNGPGGPPGSRRGGDHP